MDSSADCNLSEQSAELVVGRATKKQRKISNRRQRTREKSFSVDLFLSFDVFENVRQLIVKTNGIRSVSKICRRESSLGFDSARQMRRRNDICSLKRRLKCSLSPSTCFFQSIVETRQVRSMFSVRRIFLMKLSTKRWFLSYSHSEVLWRKRNLIQFCSPNEVFVNFITTKFVFEINRREDFRFIWVRLECERIDLSMCLARFSLIRLRLAEFEDSFLKQSLSLTGAVCWQRASLFVRFRRDFDSFCTRKRKLLFLGNCFHRDCFDRKEFVLRERRNSVLVCLLLLEFDSRKSQWGKQRFDGINVDCFLFLFCFVLEEVLFGRKSDELRKTSRTPPLKEAMFDASIDLRRSMILCSRRKMFSSRFLSELSSRKERKSFFLDRLQRRLVCLSTETSIFVCFLFFIFDRTMLLRDVDVLDIFVEPFIKSGFRLPNQPYSYYCRSLFFLHNETFSVWIHLAGTLILFAQVYRHLAELTSDLSSTLSLYLIYNCFGASTMLLCSAQAHLLHSRTLSDHLRSFFLDYFGINFYGFTSGIVLRKFSHQSKISSGLDQSTVSSNYDWFLLIAGRTISSEKEFYFRCFSLSARNRLVLLFYFEFIVVVFVIDRLFLQDILSSSLSVVAQSSSMFGRFVCLSLSNLADSLERFQSLDLRGE